MLITTPLELGSPSSRSRTRSGATEVAAVGYSDHICQNICKVQEPGSYVITYVVSSLEQQNLRVNSPAKGRRRNHAHLVAVGMKRRQATKWHDGLPRQ